MTLPDGFVCRKSATTRSIYVVTLCSMLFACGGGGSVYEPQPVSTGTTPSITTQPANQTVNVGQTATFSVTANGTAPLSYQWEKGGVAISGATSASYTTPTTQASDTGTTFTVTVTNAAGSVASSAATLTVTATAPVPSTSLACDGYPKTGNGTTQVCLILQEYAQVTPSVSASTHVGNLTGHGFDILNAYVVYARIIAQAADQGSATALAESVVVNTANSKISATPDQVDSPQALQIDFEIFTATNTNLTLTSGTGNISVDNYNSILTLTPNTGNVSLTTVQGQATVNVDIGNASLTTVQGQATVNVGTGDINATLSGSGWTGAGMNATTQLGNVTVSRPAAYQAAFTAKSDFGSASIDGQQAQSGQTPAVVTAGSGAPIMFESKHGDVSVTAAQ